MKDKANTSTSRICEGTVADVISILRQANPNADVVNAKGNKVTAYLDVIRMRVVIEEITDIDS